MAFDFSNSTAQRQILLFLVLQTAYQDAAYYNQLDWKILC